MGKTAYDSGESVLTSLLNCLCFPFGMICFRSNIRNDKNIEVSILTKNGSANFFKFNFKKGNLCQDVMSSICCPTCSAVQIKNEIL